MSDSEGEDIQFTDSECESESDESIHSSDLEFIDDRSEEELTEEEDEWAWEIDQEADDE
jgi:hypothetical protein